MRALAAALAVLLAAPLGAEEPPAWRAVDAATGLEQLAADFPDSATLRRRLLAAQLEQDDADGALETLRWLSARGMVFRTQTQTQAQIAERIGAAHAAEAARLMSAPAQVVTASSVVAELPAEAGLIESVLVSPGTAGAMIATSVSRRSVFTGGAGLAWLESPIASAQALSGIVSAPGGKIVWVASGNIVGAQVDGARFSGLIGLTGDMGRFALIPAPEGVTVSDLAAGPDGTVYASDPVNGGVYRAVTGARTLEALVAPGTFRSPQGLAVSADGARLYVSDYGYGLAMIDLASSAVTRLASDIFVALDGVDGLWLHDGELIAVQNGTSPMRISAFALSADGTRIVGHRVLEQAHPGWTEPLGGSLHDGALIYVATGQWDRYDKGQLREGMTALPTTIRRLSLER